MLRCLDCGTTIKLINLEKHETFDCPECGMELRVSGYELSMLHLGVSEE